MANYCKTLNVSAKSYVTPSSRYAGSKVMQYTEDKVLTFEIYKKKPFAFAKEDQWMEITAAYEYRPDLISAELYGTPDFWWKILEANEMKDIIEFVRGKNIRLPGNVF